MKERFNTHAPPSRCSFLDRPRVENENAFTSQSCQRYVHVPRVFKKCHCCKQIYFCSWGTDGKFSHTICLQVKESATLDTKVWAPATPFRNSMAPKIKKYVRHCISLNVPECISKSHIHNNFVHLSLDKRALQAHANYENDPAVSAGMKAWLQSTSTDRPITPTGSAGGRWEDIDTLLQY